MLFSFFNKYKRPIKRSIYKNKSKNKTKTINKDFILKKEQSFIFVNQRLEYFYNFYNSYFKDNYCDDFKSFEYKKVTIRDQRSRWGSCSSLRNLNFNYRIIDLDKDLADYIIVHELCHLVEMNHYKSFWDLVAISIPDYKDRIIRLKGVRF